MRGREKTQIRRKGEVQIDPLKYYRRYPGDYAKDTPHLSLIEHGVYTILLDFQYGKRRVLDRKWTDLYRLCRAQKRTEREAVKRVVEEFFPDGWNPRAKQELMKAEEAREKMSEAGKKGASERWGDPTENDGVPYEKNDGVGHPTRARSQPPNHLRTTEKEKQEKQKDESEQSANGADFELTSPGTQPPIPPIKTVSMESIKNVLLHLNRATPHNFRWLNPNDKPTAHAQAVRAVLKKGYSVDDCKQVIDTKVRQWANDDRMAQFLRPSTLFRLSNFEQYLDER